jgi:hypothetical protein
MTGKVFLTLTGEDQLVGGLKGLTQARWKDLLIRHL